VIQDETRQVPRHSYGAQKAAAELILADASAVASSMQSASACPPSSCAPAVRTRAASSFFSAVVREPLLGLPADLPVNDAFAAWLCSPRRAVDWLLTPPPWTPRSWASTAAFNPPRHQHHHRASPAGAGYGEARRPLP